MDGRKARYQAEADCSSGSLLILAYLASHRDMDEIPMEVRRNGGVDKSDHANDGNREIGEKWSGLLRQQRGMEKNRGRYWKDANLDNDEEVQIKELINLG